MKRIALALVLLSGIACAPAPVLAQDRADLERTQIVGNRELPKVLYIVPWKKPLPGVLYGRPLHSVLDEPLAPLDPEVFRRQVDYGAQLRQQLQAAAAPSPNPNPPSSNGAPR